MLPSLALPTVLVAFAFIGLSAAAAMAVGGWNFYTYGTQTEERIFDCETGTSLGTYFGISTGLALGLFIFAVTGSFSYFIPIVVIASLAGLVADGCLGSTSESNGVEASLFESSEHIPSPDG